MLTREEEKRVASYLKDYAQYLWNKQEKEYSAIIQLMIKNTIRDINEISVRLQEGGND